MKASSVASESKFSQPGLKVDDRCFRLSYESNEYCTLLKYWQEMCL